MSLLRKASIDLMVSIPGLIKLGASAPYRYKVFHVPKRSGRGTREIAQPARELKTVQRWLIEKEFTDLPVHECATAYTAGASIRKNAQVHVNSNYLLKLDFSNFFPSLVADDFRQHLLRHRPDVYDEEELLFVQGILHRYGERNGRRRLELSIGSPSSPLISNTLMFEFDQIVKEFCDVLGVNYSRYADDLSFSTDTPDVLCEITARIQRVVRQLTYPRLSLNEEKTVHTSRKHFRSVTGVVLSSQKRVSLGRERKRNIRAMVHHFVIGQLDEQSALKLRGHLGFAADVEPSFLATLKRTYSEEVIRKIQAFTVKKPAEK